MYTLRGIDTKVNVRYVAAKQSMIVDGDVWQTEQCCNVGQHLHVWIPVNNRPMVEGQVAGIVCSIVGFCERTVQDQCVTHFNDWIVWCYI